MYSDVILPAATWYEKFDIETTPMHHYLQAQSACIKPLYESRTDFDIFKDLTRRLQNEAEKLVADGQWNGKWDDTEKKQTIDFTTLYDKFSAGGKLETDVQAAKFILEKSPMMYPNPDEYRQNKKAFAPEMQKLIEGKLFAGDVSGYLDGLIIWPPNWNSCISSAARAGLNSKAISLPITWSIGYPNWLNPA